MITFASYSSVGGRTYNEDTVLTRTLGPDALCAVIADGLGGHGGGDIASRTAAEIIADRWNSSATEQTLRAALCAANNGVVARQSFSCRMRTTAVVLSIVPGRFDWANVGDSRLYHFHNDSLVWQTRDHSASQLAVFLGQITAEQIRFHEGRSRLYRALGQPEGLEVDVGSFPYIPGEHAFLLCSDGFWEFIVEQEMEAALRATDTAQAWLDKMRALVDARLEPDSDNNSAIVIRLSISF